MTKFLTWALFLAGYLGVALLLGAYDARPRCVRVDPLGIPIDAYAWNPPQEGEPRCR